MARLPASLTAKYLACGLGLFVAWAALLYVVVNHQKLDVLRQKYISWRRGRRG